MIDDKILEIAESYNDIIIDNLSEYFMQQEYYIQLATECEDTSLAGLHLQLKEFLISGTVTADRIDTIEMGELYYFKGLDHRICVRFDRLYDYEKYLISKLVREAKLLKEKSHEEEPLNVECT